MEFSVLPLQCLDTHVCSSNKNPVAGIRFDFSDIPLFMYAYRVSVTVSTVKILLYIVPYVRTLYASKCTQAVPNLRRLYALYTN